jgi:hypothetical protein
MSIKARVFQLLGYLVAVTGLAVVVWSASELAAQQTALADDGVVETAGDVADTATDVGGTTADTAEDAIDDVVDGTADAPAEPADEGRRVPEPAPSSVDLPPVTAPPVVPPVVNVPRVPADPHRVDPRPVPEILDPVVDVVMKAPPVVDVATKAPPAEDPTPPAPPVSHPADLAGPLTRTGSRSIGARAGSELCSHDDGTFGQQSSSVANREAAHRVTRAQAQRAHAGPGCPVPRPRPPDQYQVRVLDGFQLSQRHVGHWMLAVLDDRGPPGRRRGGEAIPTDDEVPPSPAIPGVSPPI